MANRPKAPRITTPVGTAKFVFINKPSTKFKEQGEYSVDLILTAEEGKKLHAELLPYAKKAKAEALAEAKTGAQKKAIEAWDVHVPVGQELDTDTGEPTGNYVLKLKRGAQFKGKDGEPVNVKIPIFDCSKPPKPIDAKVGRGSKLICNFDVRTFAMAGIKKAGVTASLNAVQVVELVEYTGGGSAESYGFGGQEGGHTAEETEEAPFAGGEAPAEGKGDGSDF